MLQLACIQLADWRLNNLLSLFTMSLFRAMQLPPHISQIEQFSDDELFRFCLANPELNVERDENGILFITMSPTHLLTSSNNSELTGEFVIWNRKTKAGKVINSNGGFFLKDKSLTAPDVAWIRKDRWDALSHDEKKSFPYLAPDFVLELQSDSDNMNDLKRKMEKWIQNGVRLAWLVSTREQQTYRYRLGQEVSMIPFSNTLYGEDVLPGFETVLADILEL
jgi:Uma2 family endonuclease